MAAAITMPLADTGDTRQAAPEPIKPAPVEPMPVIAPPAVTAPQPAPAPAAAPREISTHPNDVTYRTPEGLAVSKLALKRALIIGSCFSRAIPVWFFKSFSGMQADHILYNHAGTLPEEPPQPLDSYDFQILMLPLRTPMPEQLYFRLNYDDVQGYQAAFEDARERLLQMLHGALGYREKRPLTTFVTNFMTPQQNPMGRLLPRYDLRNPVYFVEQLNRALSDEVTALEDVHLVDIDQLGANFGRKYIQDDMLWALSHHSYLSDLDMRYDTKRIEVPAPISTQHVLRVPECIIAICNEVKAMYRTLRQVDQVKLVIIDLDDTLWRGVIAEDGPRPELMEGWPLGFAEALMFLKKRGVLLAIASKNSEERIRKLWPVMFRGRIEIADFASIKINWEPKADNIEQILKEVNLLPRSVVFIDDNPVERASISGAFPGMRVLGSSPYQLRRTLLWSAETQVAYITSESGRRTEMIQAQVEREGARTRLSRAEFLQTLNVRIGLTEVADVADSRFARAFELMNKSNQFNTTGRRWAQEECQALFARGGVLWTFEVEDRFTDYGIVGVVVVVDGSWIEQFVMSCRVVGLEVEIAVIQALMEAMREPVTARLVSTDANFLCRDLFARCGFVEVDGDWCSADGEALARPAHIKALDLRRVADAARA
jgi:FkbH-like protein